MPASRAANSDTFKSTTPSDREIILTRLFDAPRDLVFEAMSKPEHVRRWWGLLDDQHSVIVCDIDFRVGGTWRFAGRGPRGEYGFHGVYREIDAPERVVFTEIFDAFPDAGSLVTSLLTKERGKTRLTVTSLYPSREVRDMVIQSGMERGAAISYDHLEEVAQGLVRNARD
jgi:uncharacterized protein YndB with AHSA1/START domain